MAARRESAPTTVAHEDGARDVVEPDPAQASSSRCLHVLDLSMATPSRAKAQDRAGVWGMSGSKRASRMARRSFAARRRSSIGRGRMSHSPSRWAVLSRCPRPWGAAMLGQRTVEESAFHGGHGVGPLGAHSPDGETRRDFLRSPLPPWSASAPPSTLWPLITSMNPAKDTLALSTTEVDLAGPARPAPHRQLARASGVRRPPPGSRDQGGRQRRCRCAARPRERCRAGQEAGMADPRRRVHASGLHPAGQKSTDPRGDFGGWFCPCHGSDTTPPAASARGPAPLNLMVPPDQFLTDTTIRIG